MMGVSGYSAVVIMDSDPTEHKLGSAYRPGLASIGRSMSLADGPQAKLAAWRNGVHEALTMWPGVKRADVIDELYALAESRDLPERFGVDAIQQILADEATAAKAKKANGGQLVPMGIIEPVSQPALRWVNMSTWDTAPIPERQWSVLNRAPANQAGLFSGEGGTGKSIIELMRDAAHVVGRDWLGSLPEIGPAFYLGCEDEEDEIHRRLAAITKHYGVTFKQLIEGGLQVMCLLGQDATLCAPMGKSGKVETTALYKLVYEAAGDTKPKNISIDTLSRAFAGNEIDRTQVYAFAMHMQALANVATGSVTVLSHPSLAGIASGSGISGSTAWHGAFRFRQYLRSSKPEPGEQPDNDLRELEFRKNQYGPLGEKVVLRYERGLFLPVGGQSTLERAAREYQADEVFLHLLRRLSAQGRNVSEKVRANEYAPRVFATEAEAKEHQLRETELEGAMRRLFEVGKIRVEHYGRPSRPYSRIVAI